MWTSVSPRPTATLTSVAVTTNTTTTANMTSRQGRTLVHYSAQLEPFLTPKHTLNTPTIR